MNRPSKFYGAGKPYNKVNKKGLTRINFTRVIKCMLSSRPFDAIFFSCSTICAYSKVFEKESRLELILSTWQMIYYTNLIHFVSFKQYSLLYLLLLNWLAKIYEIDQVIESGHVTWRMFLNDFPCLVISWTRNVNTPFKLVVFIRVAKCINDNLKMWSLGIFFCLKMNYNLKQKYYNINKKPKK